MLQILDRNMATIAMLVGLILVLGTLVLLVMSGKVGPDSNLSTGLVSLASGAVGGITGYSMRDKEHREQ